MEDINSFIASLSVLKNIYDFVRIVDPLQKKIVEYKKGQMEINEGSCYDFWKVGKQCENCISMRAFDEDKTIVKMEYDQDRLYMVIASPIKINNDKYIVELLKDITESGVIEDFYNRKKEEITNIICKMNNALVRDELTGIYNRRFINEKLPVDICRSISLKEPLSIIMMDIDHFKYVNDNFGHLAGDYILKEFAGLVKNLVSKKDNWIARYGGEEFIIVLENAGEEKAYEVAEMIRKATENHHFKYNKSKIKITLSLGTYTINKFSEYIDKDKCIDYADRNLYEAKRRGRNITIK